jgi:hypothetical protein
MTNLTISRFLSAHDTSKPEDTHHAPIATSDEEAYDFLTLIRTHGEHQSECGLKHLFSFSEWDGGHDEWCHVGASCVTLEYKLAAAQAVRDMLPELGLAAYEIETKAGRSDAVLFAFPCKEALGSIDVTRAASLIAEALECDGLIKSSFLYTYFFRFRHNGTVRFHEGSLVSKAFLQSASKVFVKIEKWFS